MLAYAWGSAGDVLCHHGEPAGLQLRIEALGVSVPVRRLTRG